MPARRPAALAATLLLLAATTACSLLAVPADRFPKDPPATVRPPKQVLLSASQRLDDTGGAQLQVVEEGPGGRRSATGTLRWGAVDTVELTVTDELGTARLHGQDGGFELTHQGTAAPPKRADRIDVESLDPRGPGVQGGWAGGWMSGLVANPGGPAHAMALTGKLTALGGEQLAGTLVAHYRGSAPVRAFFADQGMTGPQLSTVVAYYQHRGVSAIGYDFWVAPGDRLVRLRTSAEGPQGTTVTTTDVSDPGTAAATPAATG